jgi:hypothetical protein
MGGSALRTTIVGYPDIAAVERNTRGSIAFCRARRAILVYDSHAN